MRLFYVHTGSFSVLPGNAIYLRPSQNSYNRQGFVFKVANTTPLVCPIAALLFLAVVSRVFFKGTWVPLTGLTIVRQEDGLFGHPPVIIMISHPDPPLPRRPEAL